MNAVADAFAARLAELGHEMANLAQVQCPLTHRFAPGVYLREIFMPAGTLVIGKVHKTEHFNVLLQGACLIAHPDGRLEELRAPMTFISKAGVQKALYILDDMIWQTIHPTSETDMTKLAELLVEPCEFAVPQLQADMKKIVEELQ